ncbi:MAG: ABC transporter substrate-binding protein [Geminicoccaceae bacterium]
MHIVQSRRDFLTTLTAAGAAGALGARGPLADEAPPETTTIRLRRDPSICVAPWYVAEDLLRTEGFTDISYVPAQSGLTHAQMIAHGDIDLSLYFAASAVARLDGGMPITVLAGAHAGCFELFAHEPVRTISDLKGKKVGIDVLSSAKHQYVAIMAANVGLDPNEDIEWVAESTLNPMELFAEGKVDAFLGFPPEPQELRTRGVGRVIVNTTTDKPWSQYFCCMLMGNREFIHNHPIATKRVLRALLKASDICSAEPERAAQRLVDAGFAHRYDYALQMLSEIPYGAWREFDPEDAMRFYALRLHEAGMIRSTPNQLIAQGTDWRFLNELKRELKA